MSRIGPENAIYRLAINGGYTREPSSSDQHKQNRLGTNCGPMAQYMVVQGVEALVRIRRETAGLVAFAFLTLAGQFAGAAESFCFRPHAFLRRFLVTPAKFHLTEDTLALHFLLQRLEGLFDVIITYNDLNDGAHLLRRSFEPINPALCLALYRKNTPIHAGCGYQLEHKR